MVYLYRRKVHHYFCATVALKLRWHRGGGGKEDYSSTPISIFIISQAE